MPRKVLAINQIFIILILLLLPLSVACNKNSFISNDEAISIANKTEEAKLFEKNFKGAKSHIYDVSVVRNEKITVEYVSQIKPGYKGGNTKLSIDIKNGKAGDMILKTLFYDEYDRPYKNKYTNDQILKQLK